MSDGADLARLREYDAQLEGLQSGQCSLQQGEQLLKDFDKLLAQAPLSVGASELNALRERLETHRVALQQLRSRTDRAELLGDGAKKRQVLKAKTQAEAEHSEVLELKSARDEMRNQLERMHYVNENLQDSSRTIGKTQDALQEYDSKLASAAKALGQLKRKTEEDSRYIWWSFYFFMAVVAYIVLRRLKVFKMIYYGISFGLWSTNNVLDVLQSTREALFGAVSVESDVAVVDAAMSLATADR
ncbi:unnamed protein product [Cladocopium goreaui]|uniref:Vesicle transport protein n=1 Tax=Cladocopium goreaui TaxID=2562237 RepID=A0A9P1BQB3_9DINO|nr:unnamed protein product [Cladocopium goreaui]